MNRQLLLAGLLATVPALGLTQPISYVEAPVVEVEPIVQIVTRKIPHEICRDERVKVVQAGGSHSSTPGLLGAVIGGTVAGAAGNHSGYQSVLAGAGALLGASIGNDVAHQRASSSYYVTERTCDVDYELQDSERVVGYRVGYRYQDTIQYTRTTTPPGPTLRLQVEVTPLE